VRGNGRKEKFTGRVPTLKRGARASGKQQLAVDGVRGGSGGRQRDASTRGEASEVGEAAGGRAGGQMVQEEW
jgi:hypothetical protein